jgi:ATP-binding cassette subfamily F protein uup
MALIALRDVSLSFGDSPVLERVNLTVEDGEKICLLGRNGAGKSTLMGIVDGRVTPDSGDVMRPRDLLIGSLPQGVPEDLGGSVFDVICRRLGPAGRRLADHRRLAGGPAADFDPPGEATAELARLQQTIDNEDGWRIRQQVERIVSQMSLSLDDEVSTFSAGIKRQVLLAAALAARPDLLLLDEPTNHLDMSAIEWLETVLSKWSGTLILVTHDRMMMQRLARRIVEIDRGALHSWQGGYAAYLQRSGERLRVEEQDNARFDKHLAAEEAWVRQGIKARRTRNEGRVRALVQLRDIRRGRRDPTGTVRMGLSSAERSGKVIVEAHQLSFAYGEQKIVSDFSITIMRGDRIGILGPNGAGKSTLIRLLLGELPPQNGRIKHGTHLEVIYFDQLRAQLDEGKTVQENISPDSDMIAVGGRRRHVIGYLKDFLFTPQRARTPVGVLSGGEKNRLLLARLFARPANVVVLDEPTNDLDVETLELLEALLLEYDGTVLVVSHDRAFINQVVTSTLVFEGDGRVQGYAGGYDDWLIQRPTASEAPAERPARSSEKRAVSPPVDAPKKLGYMQQRELAALPAKIEALEARQKELFRIMSDPDFYRDAGDAIAAVKQELAGVERELERAFARWETLESMNST